MFIVIITYKITTFAIEKCIVSILTMLFRSINYIRELSKSEYIKDIINRLKWRISVIRRLKY